MSARVVLPQSGIHSTSTNKINDEVAQASNNNMSSNNNLLYTATWRKRGEQVRAALVKQDEANGAQTFILSSSCPIYKYYDVADKVLDQFLHHPIDSSDELLEAYMVGQRLVKFLSTILPTHGEYSTATDYKAKVARERSLEQLAVVTKYIDQISLLIDKQEHEDYISSVINQHQFEKSIIRPYVDPKQREDVYYTDDIDDDGERNGTYLATNNTRGSDTTERLNNISNGNSGDSSYQQRPCQLPSSNRTEPRLPLSIPSSRNELNIKQTYQPNNQDSSIMSDSVDVLYDNSIVRDGFLREDPVSTASHTILRVVSPYQNVHEPMKVAQNNSTEEGNNLRIADESFESTNKLPKGMKNLPEMPTTRSHWVAANRSTNCNNATPRSTDTSFSSVDRSVGTTSIDEMKVMNVSQQSPGGSVRNIIRSWPPKQDPPGETPGINSKTLKIDVPTKKTLTPDVHQVSMEGDSSSAGNRIVEAETITLQFVPMSELQVMAADLDKGSPSRNQTNNPRTMSNTTRFLTRRDPSIGIQFARFSSTSYSTSSCDHSAVDESNILNTSCLEGSNANKSVSANALTVDRLSMMPSKGQCNPISHKSEVESVNLTEQNTSLDGLDFQKNKSPSSDLNAPNVSLEARILSIASYNSHTSHPNPSPSDFQSSSLPDTSNPHNGAVLRCASESDKIDFPVQFPDKVELLDQPLKHELFSMLENKPTNDVSHVSSHNSFKSSTHGCRQGGPVDLDDSTSTQDTLPPYDKLETKSSASRGFATDGLDYVLPLPKVILGTKSVLASYAPSTADWSMEEDFEAGNRRFARENSTISIDSTEFSGHPEKIKDALNKDRKDSDSQDPDKFFGPSLDWTPVWSPQDFDSILSSDKSKGKATDRSNMSHSSIGRPDLSYEAWGQVWNDTTKQNNESHSPYSRKEVIDGVQKGKYCTDRTSSTESSSSTSRSRDVSQDVVSSSARTYALLDTFSSRTPIEAPFLRDEQESPSMIDSMTEQRLRVPMNGNNNIMKRSPNILNLAPHNVGLYGSLKGFHTLDCIIPFDHEDANQNVEYTRGNIMLCRSRAINTTHNRSPNEEDWEESSLLMIESQKSDAKFKNCVRCLLK